MKKAVLVIIIGLIFGLYAEMTQKELEDAYDSSFKYEASQKYDKAISALSGVIKNYPSGYTVNYRLGWLYYLQGNFANGMKHLENALAQFPYSVEVMNTINLIYASQLEWEKVEVQSGRIMKIDYYNYYANYWYSVALFRQKKYDQAVKAAEKMLAVFPSNIEFLNILAESKFLKGDKEEALKIFAGVIILQKDNETAKYYLGR
ncbi:MAG TPA: tetratricopeptide repeat protein [Clostridiales bacterium]|nr:tetratricopeptide repeat protein [Clostridiales bacterium]HQP70079.1 tetratricopeptide repeat protein [Clostridiales bacterium]